MDRRITTLKLQKRNPNRVNVYLDGEYAFGLSRIVAAWLRVGQVLDEQKISELQQQDTIEVALQKAIQFISYRPRTKFEIQKKLSELGYAEPAITTVMERLESAGLVKDTQFARLWVENRNGLRPRSRRLLTLELRQKGVAEDAIQDALTDCDQDEELAYRAAQARSRRLQGLDWESFRRKLGGFLGRRGFSYGTMTPVIRQVWSELQSSEGANLFDDEDNDDQWTH